MDLPETLRADASALIRTGRSADLEKALDILRRHGFDKMRSVTFLIRECHLDLKEADYLVHLSKTWSDCRAEDERLHDELLDSLGSDLDGPDSHK